jgi:hypothetical protein
VDDSGCVPGPFLLFHPGLAHAVLAKDAHAACLGNVGLSLSLLVGKVGLIERNADRSKRLKLGSAESATTATNSLHKVALRSPFLRVGVDLHVHSERVVVDVLTTIGGQLDCTSKR